MSYQINPVETGPEREKRLWLESLARFRSLWYAREEQTIAFDDPLHNWVERQRKLHRNNMLVPWKRRQLDMIAFPYEPANRASSPDNMGYALLLCAFHAEHGHYAPTQTVGGPDLMRWVRLMRQSSGQKGVIAETAESARAALDYLKLKIPDFDLAKTGMCDVNWHRGRSSNRFGAAAPPGWDHPSERCKDVPQRLSANSGGNQS